MRFASGLALRAFRAPPPGAASAPPASAPSGSSAMIPLSRARQPDQLLCVLSDYSATSLVGARLWRPQLHFRRSQFQMITLSSRRTDLDCVFIRSQHRHTTLRMLTLIYT